MIDYTMICKKTWTILGTVKALTEALAIAQTKINHPKCDILAIQSSLVLG
jgi:hypothetical protein